MNNYSIQPSGLLNQGNPAANISANGMLSKDINQPYVPAPINVNVPHADKPSADWVNVDKAKAAAEAAQAAQQQQQAAQQSGGKIICQQYHKLGILSDELNTLDQAYGAWLMKTNRKWQQGYLRYARHIVKHLHRETWQSRLLIFVLTPLVKVWAQEMGYRMGGKYKHSLFGSFLMWLMVRVFMTLNSVRVIGLRVKSFFRKKVSKLVAA